VRVIFSFQLKQRIGPESAIHQANKGELAVCTGRANMQRSITWFVLPLGAILLIGAWSELGNAQEPAKNAVPAAKEETIQGETASVWMRKKLDLSRNMLGGIAAGNFEEISKNAHAMRTLSKFESFVRRNNPGYRSQVDFFEHSLDEIISQAKKENLEGVTLGFNLLTNSCVSCHKQLREKK
jgi:hypothetical protein